MNGQNTPWLVYLVIIGACFGILFLLTFACIVDARDIFYASKHAKKTMAIVRKREEYGRAGDAYYIVIPGIDVLVALSNWVYIPSISIGDQVEVEYFHTEDKQDNHKIWWAYPIHYSPNYKLRYQTAIGGFLVVGILFVAAITRFVSLYPGP